MAGAILIVVALLLLPVVVLMSGGVLSAVIGQVFHRDATIRHAGDERLDLDD